MGALLSKKEKSDSNHKIQEPGTISATDRAVLDLKNSRDRLTRYKTKLDTDETKLFLRAKQCQNSGNKTMAIHLLKLRKHKLNEASKVENQLLTVLQMVDTISSKENEAELVKAMKVGKDALSRLHKEMSVDDVLDLMDEVKEGIEVENEINNILAQGTPLSAVDDSEVEAELAALEKEMEEEEAEAKKEEEALPEVTLPEVPTGELPKLPEKEKEDLVVEEQSESPERVMVAS